MHVASTPTEDHSSRSISSESGFEQVVTSLPDIPEKEVIISELDVLQSIYGDQAIAPWRPSSSVERAIPLSESYTVRYQVSFRYDHPSPLPVPVS